jgi:predicted RNase H-like nuclease (RuvC/YqgF family)
MSEQTQQPNDELETLRRTNGELTDKNRKRKARIEELEASLTSAQQQVNELLLNRPIKQLAAAISTSPETLIPSLLSDYKVELLQGGELVLQTHEGKPVMHEGVAVPFEPDAIRKLLLATKDESKKRLYESIIIVSRASGAATVSEGRLRPEPKAPIQFGLR